MDLASKYLLYLTVFRMGIIGAGITSIILGYRLFAQAVLQPSSTTSVQAKAAGASFTLKNAAPGTAFGLFGVILITAMLLQGSPQLTLETLKKAADDSDVSSKIVMRGGEASDQFAVLVQQGVALEQAGNAAGAIEAYEKALSGLALPINQLALLYSKRNRNDDALLLARLGVQLRPTDADILDTLAGILAQKGDNAEASMWMERAATLDSRYRNKLNLLKHVKP